MERRCNVRLTWRLEIEARLQLDIVLLGNANRETALESGDPGNSPAIKGLAGETLVLGHGQFPVVAQDKSMACIIQRARTVTFRIDGVNEILEGRGEVEGFTEGVGGLHLQAMRETFLQASLETVVRGIGDGVLGENVGENIHAVGGASGPGQRIAKRRGVGANPDKGYRRAAGCAGDDASGWIAGRWAIGNRTGNVRAIRPTRHVWQVECLAGGEEEGVRIVCQKGPASSVRIPNRRRYGLQVEAG